MGDRKQGSNKHAWPKGSDVKISYSMAVQQLILQQNKLTGQDGQSKLKLVGHMHVEFCLAIHDKYILAVVQCYSLAV